MAITGQAKRRRIVINADAYISSATSNVPVLVKFNSTSHPDLFLTGDDKDSVWFSLDAGGQTTLYHEGVVFDSTDAIFYVKVDLSSTADTVIYFWYGQPAITGTESKTNVWTNGVRIFHFSEASGATINDSSSNATNGTAYGTYSRSSSDAKVGQKLILTSGTCYVDVGTLSLASASHTILFWLKTTQGYVWMVNSGSTGNDYIQTVKTTLYYASNAGSNYRTWTHGLTLSNWNFICFDKTSTTNVDFYANGAEVTTNETTVGSIDGAIAYNYLNRFNTTYYAGEMDEWWWFSDSKGSNFIKAVYNNTGSYSTFITIDGAVTIGSSPLQVYPIWATFTAHQETVNFGIGLGITVSTQTDYIRSANFGIGLSISVATQADYNREVSFGIGFGITSIEAVLGHANSVNFGIGLGMAVSTQANYNRTVNFGIGLAVAVGTTGIEEESINFGIGLGIAVSTQSNFNREVDFGIGLSISVLTSGLLSEEISFGIGLGVSVSTQADYNREVNFGIGLGIGVSETAEYERAVSFGIGLGIAVSTQSTFHRTVSFGIGLAIGEPKKDYGKSVSFGIGLAFTVTHQVYTDLDNFKIEKITVTKNIQDAMWQGNLYIDNTTIPPYYRHLRVYMADHTSTDRLVFLGFLPNADYTYQVANNKTKMTAYDYGWYLAAQYVPNAYRITDENTNPADTITALLGGNDWEKETGIEPYNIDTVDGWGTTVTKKSFVFDKKTTKKQAIDEICSHCNFIFVLKWRVTLEGHTRPCAYFIHEDDIDTDLDLPEKVTFASGNNYLKEDIKIEDKQNEKINRVRVAGANAITGDWFEAVVESDGVTNGDEIPIEYYTESSSLDTQQKVNDRADALFDFFNTVAKTYSATFINRTDLQLYQLINFTGYSYIDSEDMRIISITYNELGTHREVNVQFTSDQALSDLKSLNRSMGGDIYNNTTEIVNHYFVDLTKIAVGTITAIDGNTATVSLEDGSGYVKARLINQDE